MISYSDALMNVHNSERERKTMKILRFLGKGTGHETAGKDCQDRIGYKALPDKTILAVSDGCSSSKYAENAAQCNIDIILDIFSKYDIDSLSRSSLAKLYPVLNEENCNIAEDDIISCFEWIFKYSLATLDLKPKSKKIIKKSGKEPNNSKDLCATLLFAVWEKDKILIGHIGDGNIICFDKSGNTVFHSAQDNGKDSSHTYFTVSPDFLEHFNYDIIPATDVDSIIMFSDGPQTMFKCEQGDIVSGAYKIVAEPVAKGEIRTESELVDALREPIGHAKHYIFDDWSILIAHKEKNEDSELKPVSLYQLFKEEFRKIKFDENGDVIQPESEKQEIVQSEESDGVAADISTGKNIGLHIHIIDGIKAFKANITRKIEVNPDDTGND